MSLTSVKSKYGINTGNQFNIKSKKIQQNRIFGNIVKFLLRKIEKKSFRNASQDSFRKTNESHVITWQGDLFAFTQKKNCTDKNHFTCL